MVATEVMRMGRSRIRPASSMASTGVSPRSLSWLAYSTSRIEFLVTSPISRIMPIWLYRLIVEPDQLQQRRSAPVTASGTASSTVNGWSSDSNCEASTMNTTSSASTKAK